VRRRNPSLRKVTHALLAIAVVAYCGCSEEKEPEPSPTPAASKTFDNDANLRRLGPLDEREQGVPIGRQVAMRPTIHPRSR
jgi:hypothetical protein